MMYMPPRVSHKVRMSRPRLFLFASALVWLPYGLYCLFHPEFLASAAGVASQSPTGTTELRAMYGGLQAALGVVALAGLRQRQHEALVIGVLGMLGAGLFLARSTGVLLDGTLSAYTLSALGFEGGSATIAFLLLRARLGVARA